LDGKSDNRGEKLYSVVKVCAVTPVPHAKTAKQHSQAKDFVFITFLILEKCH
jgi:hypothetical protein